MMVSLEKEISRAKFDRLPRYVYAVHSTNGSTKYYVSKDSAYLHMEQIKHALEAFDNNVERFELDDLDVRVALIVTTAGATYSLLTLPIEY